MSGAKEVQIPVHGALAAPACATSMIPWFCKPEGPSLFLPPISCKQLLASWTTEITKKSHMRTRLVGDSYLWHGMTAGSSGMPNASDFGRHGLHHRGCMIYVPKSTADGNKSLSLGLDGYFTSAQALPENLFHAALIQQAQLAASFADIKPLRISLPLSSLLTAHLACGMKP